MIPAANSTNANSPAIGRNASAACAEVSMLVMPCACSVAAVAKTIASDTSELNAMPIIVSMRIRASSGPACFGDTQSGLVLVTVFLLDFLPCLPEEQIRANCRTKDRHHCHRVRSGQLDAGNE